MGRKPRWHAYDWTSSAQSVVAPSVASVFFGLSFLSLFVESSVVVSSVASVFFGLSLFSFSFESSGVVESFSVAVEVSSFLATRLAAVFFGLSFLSFFFESSGVVESSAVAVFVSSFFVTLSAPSDFSEDAGSSSYPLNKAAPRPGLLLKARKLTMLEMQIAFFMVPYPC